ncbi:MAG TPA: polysaccharide biosynthesis/export family protein [Chryseolinea sp.]|nr:polysaccharide biosynthesis/export family protein [Chryseolinea sp.]
MILRQFRLQCRVFIALFAFAVCSSCVNTKRAVYFNNIGDTTLPAGSSDLEPVLRPNDILSISVSSLNPEATDVFNKPNLPTTLSYTTTSTTTHATGYLVDLQGFIEFPILGTIKAAGLTKKELKEQLTKALLNKKLLVDPIVDIRYLNFRVSVMGEVARPTVVTVPSEKISLLEALALAGDLTVYARRDNVMVIREENGQRIVKRIDLNSSDLLTSPYYYLKSNDVVYAEPNKPKVASTRTVYQWLPVVFSIMSFGIIALDRY